MSTKQELRAIIDDLRDRLHSLRTERNALRDELTAARADLAQLRDQLAAREVSTPAPRPFRVGDRVRVAEGATYLLGLSGKRTSRASGRVGVVREVWSDGDLVIDTETDHGCAASPEFCTLIEPERVTLTLADGTRITFDAVVTP